MTIDTPAGTINQITPIREFVELTTITNAQYLLGIQNMSTGNGSKITFGNLITSLISGNADNKLVKGSDGKLFISTPIEIGTLANLTTTNKTNLVSAINELNSNMGSLSNLETTVKTSLVAAINSVAELTEPELLIDKVNQSKALVTGNVASYQEELEQIKLMKRSTFDRSKFTVVGSPTITDDGVASGFKKGNDLKFPAITVTDNSTIVIRTRIKTVPKAPSSDTQGQCIFGFYKNGTDDLSQVLDTYSLWNGTNITLAYRVIKEAQFISISTTPNTEYEYKVEITKNAIKCYLDGELKGQKLNLSFDMSLINNVIGSIGTGVRKGLTPTRMKIYLPEFSITVDGKEVFNGNKTGIDTIKADNYEVVGSPVISNDGVLSNCTYNADYVSSKQTFDLYNANSWEIQCHYNPMGLSNKS